MFNKGLPPNNVIEKLGKAERVLKLWQQFRRLMEDDYHKALNKITEYGLEARKDYKNPLSEPVDYLIGENYVLSDEKRLIWKLLKEKGFAHGFEEDEYYSAYETVKRLLENWLQKEYTLFKE